MITYEYKVIPGAMTQEQLNVLGAEGWKLDAILNLLTSMTFYMSRAIDSGAVVKNNPVRESLGKQVSQQIATKGTGTR